MWRRARMFQSIKSFGTVHTGTNTNMMSGFIEGVCNAHIHVDVETCGLVCIHMEIRG